MRILISDCRTAYKFFESLVGERDSDECEGHELSERALLALQAEQLAEKLSETKAMGDIPCGLARSNTESLWYLSPTNFILDIADCIVYDVFVGRYGLTTVRNSR